MLGDYSPTRAVAFRCRALRVWEAEDDDGVSGALERLCLVLLSRDWVECPLDFSLDTHAYPGFYCHLHELWRKRAPAPTTTHAPDLGYMTLLSRVENKNEVAEQPADIHRRPLKLQQGDSSHARVVELSPEAPETPSFLDRLFKRMDDL